MAFRSTKISWQTSLAIFWNNTTIKLIKLRYIRTSLLIKRSSVKMLKFC